MTEFYPQNELIPCRDLTKITKNYIFNGNFAMHFIAWLPFHYILNFQSVPELRWMFTIKCIRIIDGLRLFRVNKFMGTVRVLFKKWMMYKIEHDPSIEHNNTIDHNNIELLLKINYSLKTLKLVVQIFNVTYFLACFWFIYCEIIDSYLVSH